MKRQLLQFGAGKIGRSFIAQVFSRAGYEITFIDIDPCIVKSINEAGAYNVIIKSDDKEEKYTVNNITAIDVTSTRNVIASIEKSDIISISVGKKSLLKLARILARGIKNRYSEKPEDPIDIILAENISHAAELLSAEIRKRIPDVPIDTYVGFVETCIGKMVPVMSEEEVRKDPLSVFAEPYNKLIVDANAFRAGMPDVALLDPKTNMQAWVDRKIFIQYLGHSVLSFHSNYLYPEVTTIWEALDKKEIRKITRSTMLQSAQILHHLYPSEFTMKELMCHVDELIERFANKSLGDTVFGVGCDLSRQLARDDRLMRPVEKALEAGLNYDLIMEAWVIGCYFDARDEKGKLCPENRKFKQKFHTDPIKILENHCQFDPETDSTIFSEVDSKMKNMKHHGT